jgi:rhodanese-related sulfurtransferase
VDGIFFTLGVLSGIFLFGETVGSYEEFFHSSYLGRLTIPDWLGANTGAVVLGVVFMALFMFWGAEQLERIVGKKELSREPKWRYGAAGALVVGAVAVLIIGQPTAEERWLGMAAEKGALLEGRAVQIHPGELLSLLEDSRLQVIMLDIRSEGDYNLFHLRDARRIAPEEVTAVAAELLLEPANTVFVTMSNDEVAATEAWRLLVAQSVPNVYILEGGINHWLSLFGEEERIRASRPATGDDQLCFSFDAALGERYGAAAPHAEEYALEYTAKVQLELKRGPAGGGCG